jgi:putative membrane protein
MKLKLASVTAALFISLTMTAQQSESSNQAKGTTRIGRISLVAFNQINANGTRMVNAIKPTSAKLSAADLALFNKVALGGMRQLMISQAVLAKANDEQVRLLAQSEVEEQTTLSNKLKETAQAKGLTMPDAPDAETQALIERINGMSAEEANAIYLQEGGVKGHQMLQSTMTTVQRSAKDATMKRLATATLPVIRTHLTVAKDVQNMMSGMRK